jgi:hypothetical protein
MRFRNPFSSSGEQSNRGEVEDISSMAAMDTTQTGSIVSPPANPPTTQEISPWIQGQRALATSRYIPTEPNQHTSTNHTASPTGKCDWNLPTSFLTLLKAPLAQTINALVPLIPSQQGGARSTSSPTAPFITALLNIPNARTDNGAIAHGSTRSELVDLFFEFTPGVTPARLHELLGRSWAVDADS